MLTLNTLKVADAAGAIKTAMDANKAKGVQLVAGTMLNPPASAGRGGGLGAAGARTRPAEQAALDKGQAIYKEVCFACHGDDGRGEADAGGARGYHEGPGARGVAARDRAPGLRHQDRCCTASPARSTARPTPK